MNKTKYLEKRNGLLAAAQACVDSGDIAGFNARKAEIEQLDADFEAASTAQANLATLQNNPIAANAPAGFMASLGVPVAAMSADGLASTMEDVYDSKEYRIAFMNFVTGGKDLPAQYNANANTKTTDVGAVIPTTIMEKIIERMEAIGMILPLVTQTSYTGGLSIPTSTVKPVATWVAEGASSDRQKKTTGSITFAYHKLRCAISLTFEVTVVTLPIFEATFIRNVADSMVKAKEQAIISGDGSGKPKGILAETPPTGQTVEIAAAGKITYDTLIDAEAALPLEYETGAVWFMTKKTFMKFVGMVDDQKQPIARVNNGINGNPERTLLGRQVILNNYMSSYADTVEADTVVAFLFRPEDYLLNANGTMYMKTYEDNDTDDQVTKAIELVDGKVVDKNSLVTIVKKSA